MGNHIKARVYTEAARWYNLAFLGLITFSSTRLVFSASNAYEAGITTIEVLRSVAIALAGIIGIVGVFQEKLWAKWFTIVAYGLCISAAIEGLANSFSTEPALKLIISSNTLVALRVGRFMTIVGLLVGIVLLLKKPRLGGSLEERE